MGNTVPLTLQWARYYASLGWSVIPIKAGGKSAIVPWEKYQKERPTDEDLVKWFSRGNSNLAIVTGTISNLDVIDIDSSSGGAAMESYISPQVETPSVKTPSEEGRHLYFKHPEGLVLTSNIRKIEGCDFKSEGGYVVAPPSSNGNGKQYRWEATPKEIALASLPLDYINNVLNSSLSIVSSLSLEESAERNLSFSSLQPSIVQKRSINWDSGSRDDSLFTVANSLKRSGMEDGNIVKVLEAIAKSWGETFKDPKIEKWIRDKVKSADGREERHSGTLSKEIREWVALTNCKFSIKDCYSELKVIKKSDMNTTRVVLHGLVKSGVLERSDNKDGMFRRIEKDSNVLNWQTADCSAIYHIQWPFGLQDWVHLYPKNIVIVAGASNAGKTALLLNLARMNASTRQVRYFSSEMGPEELRLRLSCFEGVPEDAWEKVQFFDRSSGFAHAIEPNSLNVIDYLEISDNFFAVGGEIREIFDRLNKGIAVIALQKKAGAELGRGAEFTLEKARLYLSMDQGKIKIVKAKNWAKKGHNPNGKEWAFKLVNGSKFVQANSNAISEVEF